MVKRAALIFLPRPVWEPSPPLNVIYEIGLDVVSDIKAWIIGLYHVPWYNVVPMVTALLLSTVPGHHIGPLCIRTNQKFRHKFSVFECMKICSKLCLSILTSVSHYPVLQNVIFLLEGNFSLEKWKSKWPTVRNMCFQKLWKILFFITKHY